MKRVIKNKVSERRKIFNLTQSQLAKEVGVSKNAISSIERGEYFPTLRLAFLLSEALLCDIGDIFSLEWNYES